MTDKGVYLCVMGVRLIVLGCGLWWLTMPTVVFMVANMYLNMEVDAFEKWVRKHQEPEMKKRDIA